MCRLIGIFLFLISLLGCFKETGNIGEAPSIHKGKADQKEETSQERFRRCIMFSRFASDFEKAWEEFSSKNSLELARPEDFSFSAIPVDSRYRLDIEGWTKCPVIVQGDFNGDISEDFLLLAVKKDIRSRENFSLIIFNSPEDLEERKGRFVSYPKYIYKDEDLSTLYVGKSRAGLDVDKYLPDGTRESCHIEWHSKTQSYECKKTTP